MKPTSLAQFHRFGAFALPILVVALGCAPQARRPAGDSTIPNAWTSPIDRHHPLVGRIFDVRDGRFVDENALVEQLLRATFVTLGEQHDNADHHRLQAHLLDALVRRGHRPAVVFEMIDADRQEAVDASLAAHPGDADALARAVDWGSSGWPPWALYRPVFGVVLAAGLPVVGGGIPRSATRRIASEGASAVDATLVERFGLAAPPDAATAVGLRDEMRAVHCGMLPETMLDAMVLVQRVRDARLAERMATSATAGGAVLVAGAGHAREDRGVPAALRAAYGATAATMAFLEVRASLGAPAQYAAAFRASELPFDYVWFTPRASDRDPCAEMSGRSPRPG